MNRLGATRLTPTRLRRVEATVYRAPLAQPVRTSFGTMHARPAVLVRVEDDDGGCGYGEIWCNFPACGAEHRARLVESVFAPLLEDAALDDPAELFASLTERTAVLALQSGEPGPMQQCIAGIDIALWDLQARRAGEPLWRLLGGASPRIAVYASGLNPDAPEAMAAARRDEGHRAFKLKVGFGEARDLANLRALRDALGPQSTLMVDANQAWTLDTAAAMAARMAEHDIAWIEEPLRADRPWHEWRALAARSPIALAAGENLAGDASFEGALASGALRVVQPDVAKWGGISGCLPVARAILHRGVRYCPHWLGAGVGLLASAHVLAAVGGDGLLEVDANPNPLRELTCGSLRDVDAGHATLGSEPGLGPAPDPALLRAYAVPL